MSKMMTTVMTVGVLAWAAVAGAQTTAKTAMATPIFVNTTTTTPLRVAAVGTTLQVVEEGEEWVRVAYQDPTWGRRVGYAKRTNLQIANPTLQPMDLSVATLELPVPTAAAQQPVQAPAPTFQATPLFRQHVVFRSGGTFGTQPAMLFGVEGSGDVTSMLQVYGLLDYHQNAAPKYFEIIEDITSWLTGVDVDMKTPALVGMGGVKLVAPTKYVRPYGLGGFGVTHGRLKVKAGAEDVTDIAEAFSGMDFTYTKPMFEVGGGVVVPVGHFYLDAGYRFRKALNIDDINTSAVSVGAGVSF